MLKLITGSNGAGKSLRAIQRMYADHAAGLQVFASGFRNIRVPFVQPWADPRKWRELPPGSVLYVDEAQQVWRARSAGAKVPAEVLDLETHRHQGLDIVLITQGPSYIDSHLRPLFSEHEHLVAYGSSKSRLFRFAECYENVKSLETRGRGEFQIWDHPVAHYGDYDSAEVHTPKPPIPWKERVGRPILLGIAALCAVYVVWQIWDVLANGGMSDRVREADAKAKTTRVQTVERGGLGSLFGSMGGTRVQSYRNLADYMTAHRARDPAMPWTMPALDGREVKADPQLFCMASGEPGSRDRSCSCVTEQGTRHLLDRQRCEYIARWGGAYNPFREPQRAIAAASGLGAATSVPQPAVPPAGDALSGSVVAGDPAAVVGAGIRDASRN